MRIAAAGEAFDGVQPEDFGDTAILVAAEGEVAVHPLGFHQLPVVIFAGDNVGPELVLRRGSRKIMATQSPSRV